MNRLSTQQSQRLLAVMKCTSATPGSCGRMHAGAAFRWIDLHCFTGCCAGSIKGEEKISIAQIVSHKTSPNQMIFMNSGEYMW